MNMLETPAIQASSRSIYLRVIWALSHFLLLGLQFFLLLCVIPRNSLFCHLTSRHSQNWKIKR